MRTKTNAHLDDSLGLDTAHFFVPATLYLKVREATKEETRKYTDALAFLNSFSIRIPSICAHPAFSVTSPPFDMVSSMNNVFSRTLFFEDHDEQEEPKKPESEQTIESQPSFVDEIARTFFFTDLPNADEQQAPKKPCSERTIESQPSLIDGISRTLFFTDLASDEPKPTPKKTNNEEKGGHQNRPIILDILPDSKKKRTEQVIGDEEPGLVNEIQRKIFFTDVLDEVDLERLKLEERVAKLELELAQAKKAMNNSKSKKQPKWNFWKKPKTLRNTSKWKIYKEPEPL